MIPLEKEVMAIGGVEIWLGELLREAQSSLGSVIANAYAFLSDPEFSLLALIENFPAQVIIFFNFVNKSCNFIYLVYEWFYKGQSI